MARSDAPAVASHADLGQHEKTKALCSLLSVRRAEGIGLVTSLWHFCARDSPDDGLIACGPGTLADELYWGGDPEKLWKALVDSGYIDIGLDGQARAHEWSVYGEEHQLVKRKRDYDKRRLQRLRDQEQLALAIEIPPPQVGSQQESELPESTRIHVALCGNGSPPLPNDLRRINHTLEKYPSTHGYETALNYVAWQLDVAKSYREHKKGMKPHTDPIKGWENQMRMHAKNGWSKRDSPLQKTKMLDWNDGDLEKYSA